jgi:hypothetical protein
MVPHDKEDSTTGLEGLDDGRGLLNMKGEEKADWNLAM